MLIECDRHTKEDLELWQEYESSDKIHGQTLDGKITKAVSDIRKFCRDKCYAATSWGKDSLAMCCLLAQADVNVPVVFIRQVGLMEDPYQIEVQRRFCEEYGFSPDVIEVKLAPYESTGRSPGLEEGIAISRSKYGKRYISGIRADESAIRTLASFRLKSSCWPLKNWAARDVFGLIARFELPLHPAYAMTGGGRFNRDQIRVSIIGGNKGLGAGRREWEQEYYSDIINRIKHAAC